MIIQTTYNIYQQLLGRSLLKIWTPNIERWQPAPASRLIKIFFIVHVAHYTACPMFSISRSLSFFACVITETSF